jgi:hypothetical protein
MTRGQEVHLAARRASVIPDVVKLSSSNTAIFAQRGLWLNTTTSSTYAWYHIHTSYYYRLLLTFSCWRADELVPGLVKRVKRDYDPRDKVDLAASSASYTPTL